MEELRFGIGNNDEARLVNYIHELELFLDEIITEDHGGIYISLLNYIGP